LFGTTIVTLVELREPTVCSKAAPDVAALPADVGVHRVAPQTLRPQAGVSTVVVRKRIGPIIGHVRRQGVPTLTLDLMLARVHVTSVAECRYIAVRCVRGVCMK